MLKIASAQMNRLMNSELIPSSFYSSPCADGQITNNCGLTEELPRVNDWLMRVWHWWIHRTIHNPHTACSLFSILFYVFIFSTFFFFCPFLWTVKSQLCFGDNNCGLVYLKPCAWPSSTLHCSRQNDKWLTYMHAWLHYPLFPRSV